MVTGHREGLEIAQTAPTDQQAPRSRPQAKPLGHLLQYQGFQAGKHGGHFHAEHIVIEGSGDQIPKDGNGGGEGIHVAHVARMGGVHGGGDHGLHLGQEVVDGMTPIGDGDRTHPIPTIRQGRPLGATAAVVKDEIQRLLAQVGNIFSI